MKKLYTILTILILFTITTVKAQTILLVADATFHPERVEPLKQALTNLGYTYSFYDAQVEAASPSADYLASFDLVIWYTSGNNNLYFWNNDDTDNEALKSYLDQGGMMWLQGVDFIKDRYGNAPDTFHVGDFVYDYLGIAEVTAQTSRDDGVYSKGVPFYEVVPNNGIFTLDTLKWAWSTLYNADAMKLVDSAKALYIMGPPEYDLGGSVGALYYEKDSAKVMTFSIAAGKLDAQWRLDTLYAQGLRYFKQFAKKQVTLVESISIATTSGKNTIDEKGGTLQFEATVLPDDATNKNVEWTLENNTANATIDQNGLLKATGVSNGNGTVTVVASALDGSGITASMDVTITNQGDASDYEILLVNDNANGTDRYLSLETALVNNEYNFTVYNTVTTNDYPDLDYLSVFDVVVWYTGNDGLNLKLWDVSDSTDMKFNAPLKSYLDQGGIVWLQGLDFFYDVFGKAPYPAGDDNFTAGSFIYDYMGIKKYVAQTKADDGGKGVPQLDVVADNGFCELSPVLWKYTTMWYVDALAITDNAVGIYKLGPSDYVYNPFYAGVFNRNGKSKLMTFTFETARLDSQDNLDELFYEVLEAFRVIVDDVEDPLFDNTSISIYPNPVSDNIKIDYTLLKPSNVTINITNINGAVIFTQNEGNQFKGQHISSINLNNSLNSGTYFVNIIAGNQAIAKKIVLIK